MAHPDATIIWGAQLDETLEDTIRVTVVATGLGEEKKEEKVEVDVLDSILSTTTDEDETYDDVMSFFQNN
jgi:cell division protein FtsZ